MMGSLSSSSRAPLPRSRDFSVAQARLDEGFHFLARNTPAQRSRRKVDAPQTGLCDFIPNFHPHFMQSVHAHHSPVCVCGSTVHADVQTFFARRSPCTMAGSHSCKNRIPLTMSRSICMIMSESSSNVWFMSMSERLPLSHSWAGGRVLGLGFRV